MNGGTSAALYNWTINSYAPNGDVLSMTDYVMGNWTYAYDDFNRLTGGTATAGVDDGLELNWTYDRYGNRWSQAATGSGNASAVQPNLSFTGNTNRVDGWSYDAAGNLLNDGRNSYSYDAEGRIVSLNGQPTYLYDAEGRRVAKYSGSTITASYLLDLGGNQVTELNTSGQWVHSNVYAGGRLVATYEGTAGPKPNTWHFHLTDWLGTQRMQTFATGNQEEVCYSYPFGDGLTCTGTDATEHHFTGKERDTESGNDYFEARYYQSSMGRFVTPDWDAKPINVPYASFGDPQTLNLYAYVENGPLNRVDADGHAAAETTGLAGNTQLDEGMFGQGGPCAPNFSAFDPCEAAGDGTARNTFETAYLTQENQAFASTGNNVAQQQNQNSTPAHFDYSISTGELWKVDASGNATFVSSGYSGKGNGLNNPYDQDIQGEKGKADAGPIPAGNYTIGKMFDNTGKTGPGSMRLKPDAGNEMNGRSGFLIHGDNRKHDFSASEGCIILSQSARNAISSSGITRLEVNANIW